MSVIISVIKLLGGVGILIYGMTILSSNLKKMSGGKLEKMIASVTDNKFKGLIIGILITVVIQSSSATTVITIGLVNAEVLKLVNAIPIIMGANIGTTITSQILRLTEIGNTSYFSLLSPEVLAPIFVVIGLVLVQFGRNNKKVIIGQMLIGVGLIFIGMITMVNVANEFTDLAIVSKILSRLSNPILGVLVGILITFIIQSSSATVGVLQALSTTGTLTFATTIPIIVGQNIGTCGTSIISSIGTSKNAKRAAVIHLYFNIIGTIIFLVLIYTYQALVGFSFWYDPINMGQIANFHTLFNVISTIILFPFIDFIEKLAMITIKDKPKLRKYY